MRRGLISWSHDEMPPAVLDARVRALQEAMTLHNWQATLAYSSIAQPSAVNWLTHFTPYWSEALLVVFQSGPPILLASLTKRVHTWIHEVSHLGEIRMAPKLGENALQCLTSQLAPGAKVGVIGLESLPGSVSRPMIQAGGPLAWESASEVFASLRMGSDASEKALVKKAEHIAQEAFKSLASSYTDSSALASTLELHARLAGAEEVIIRVAPDLSQDARLQRLEGHLPLSAIYGVELSLAYKGVWVRMIENYAADTAQHDFAALKTWWAQVVHDFEFKNESLPTAYQGHPVEQVRLECAQRTYPLEVVDLQHPALQSPNAWGVLSAEVNLGFAHWPLSQPVYAS
jgi:hypothetical protein